MRTRALNHPKQQAISVWKHFSLKANDRMHHSIMTSFSLLHDGREVICSDMMTVEGMLILHFASLTESSQRLQIRCWNTQIFLKCKRYTSVMSKTGHLKVKCSCENESEVCPNNINFIFTPLFSTKFWKSPRLSFSLLFLFSWTQFAIIVSCIQGGVWSRNWTCWIPHLSK